MAYLGLYLFFPKLCPNLLKNELVLLEKIRNKVDGIYPPLFMAIISLFFSSTSRWWRTVL